MMEWVDEEPHEAKDEFENQLKKVKQIFSKIPTVSSDLEDEYLSKLQNIDVDENPEKISELIDDWFEERGL